MRAGCVNVAGPGAGYDGHVARALVGLPVAGAMFVIAVHVGDETVGIYDEAVSARPKVFAQP